MDYGPSGRRVHTHGKIWSSHIVSCHIRSVDILNTTSQSMAKCVMESGNCDVDMRKVIPDPLGINFSRPHSRQVVGESRFFKSFKPRPCRDYAVADGGKSLDTWAMIFFICLQYNSLARYSSSNIIAFIRFIDCFYSWVNIYVRVKQFLKDVKINSDKRAADTSILWYRGTNQDSDNFVFKVRTHPHHIFIYAGIKLVHVQIFLIIL